MPGGDVVYAWRTDRSAHSLHELVPSGYVGMIGCDAYSAYDAFAGGRGGIALVACMAHIRRKFHDAQDERPRFCAWVLRQFGLLYRIEAGLRGRGPALRAAVRASQSRLIYDRLGKALRIKSDGDAFLPGSQTGKAVRYALENWEAMRPWLEDGRVEIDNNLVENAIRPTAIGKKNWLFIGSAEAGQTAEVLYTLAECCRRHGIDSFEYFRDVLERLPGMTNTQVGELTPAAWAAARMAAPEPLAAAA